MFWLFLLVATAAICESQILFPDQQQGFNPPMMPMMPQVLNFGRCRVVGNELGLCVMINDCPALASYTTRPLSRLELQTLRQRNCGYYYNTPLVCCSFNQPAQPQPPVVAPTPAPPPFRPVTSAPPAPTRATPRPPAPPPSTGPSDQLTSRVGILPEPGVCGSGVSDRIIGGNITRIGEYRWMALLQYTKPQNAKGFHCGGALINSRYVLTASHCVNGRSIPRNWRLTHVRLGEWDLDQDPDCESGLCADPVVDVEIEEQIPHDTYDPNSAHQSHDIALLRLAREIPYTDWIRPICLPIQENLRNDNYINQVMDVVGWGRTETARQSDVKLKASLKIVGSDRCDDKYRERNVALISSQICAGGEEGIDSCSGDSGGPLVGIAISPRRIPYYYVAAVVSMGPTPCAQKNFPGIYTRTASYIDWIQRTVRA